MMDVLEAYERTLDAAEDLREAGILVKATPSQSPNDGANESLPRAKWVIIEFFPKDSVEADTIRKKATELGWAGIVFDTSGHVGQRQWEVDWSFRVGEIPDGEWEAAGEEVEGMIEKMGKGPGTTIRTGEVKIWHLVAAGLAIAAVVISCLVGLFIWLGK